MSLLPLESQGFKEIRQDVSWMRGLGLSCDFRFYFAVAVARLATHPTLPEPATVAVGAVLDKGRTVANDAITRAVILVPYDLARVHLAFLSGVLAWFFHLLSSMH
jgi:hypothetical protein